MSDNPIETALDAMDGRFQLVIVSSRRARQINAYYNELGEGIGSYVPPQVHSLSRKPLTIAFEEIADEKVSYEVDEA